MLALTTVHQNQKTTLRPTLHRTAHLESQSDRLHSQELAVTQLQYKCPTPALVMAIPLDLLTFPPHWQQYNTLQIHHPYCLVCLHRVTSLLPYGKEQEVYLTACMDSNSPLTAPYDLLLKVL